MKQFKNRKFHIIMTALITVTMVTGLMLPLQAEVSSAAPKMPKFSNKALIKAKQTPVKRKRKKLNLRLEALQPVTGYDTIQGSCYGGGYYYFLMYCRAKNKCRIVKMKRSNHKVVKISKALKLDHGNDMTYNFKSKKIVVCHAKPVRKKISVISPKSLKIQKTVTVDLPKDVSGINWSRVKKKGGYKGFSSIAYNLVHDQYVVQLYSSRDFLFLDSKFKPVRYVQPTKWDSQLYQGMDSFGDRIVVCNSFAPGKPDNVLSVYDWDGKYLSKVKLARGMELESIFHVNSKLYACYYKAYTARYLWANKYKKKGRTRVYVKKRKLGHKFLNRDGYLYRITKL